METIKKEKKAEGNEIVYELLDHWTLVEYCKKYSDCLKFQAKLIHKLTTDNLELRERLREYEGATLIGEETHQPLKREKSS